MSDPVEGSDAWKAQNKGPMVLAACWTLTAISTLFVAARLYVRGRIHRKFQHDDYYIIAGLICAIATTAMTNVAVSYGNGRHFSLLSVSEMEGVILWTTIAFCPGVLAFGLPKLAVVVLLTRLLNPTKYHRWFLWWIGIWCNLGLIADVGVLLGRCTPTRSMWDFSVTGTCFDVNILIDYSYYAGSFSAFADLYLAIYPTIVLFQLQLGLKKRIALCVALGIGSVSGIIAIYKTTRLPSLGSADFSYDTADLVVWTVIEGSAIIIASSIPILQPLMEIILRRNIFTSGKYSKSAPRYYEDYSKQSKSGIELDQRKTRAKSRDELALGTMLDDGSQEEILSPEHKVAESLGSEAWTSNNNHSNGGIVQTKVISVSYDTSTSDKSDRDPDRWMKNV